jgi:hypothetical protein
MSARPIATGNHLVPRHTTVNGTGLLVGLVAAMALAGYLIGFSPSDEVQNVRGQSCDGASHVRSQCIERRSAAGAVVSSAYPTSAMRNDRTANRVDHWHPRSVLNHSLAQGAAAEPQDSVRSVGTAVATWLLMRTSAGN